MQKGILDNCIAYRHKISWRYAMESIKYKHHATKSGYEEAQKIYNYTISFNRFCHSSVYKSS